MSSKAPEVMACPACGTELTLEHLVGSLDDEQAFSRLVALSVPMAHLVVQYIGLFTPEKQRLTLRKKVRLIAQLGGFLARKHDGEPGAKTLWLGMREVNTFVRGVRFAKEMGTCV